jgi:hypothetical protein
VSVIDDDCGVVAETRVVHDFVEEYAVGHVFEEGGAGLGHFFETIK